MNQHFNKKSIEAAVRVALVMPGEDIMINGRRSNRQFSFYYDKDVCKLYLDEVIRFDTENDYQLISSFDISSPIKNQRSVSKWVNNVVNITLNEIK